MYPEFVLFGHKMGMFPICVGLGLFSGTVFIFWQLKRTAASPEIENSTMLAVPLTFITGTAGAHLADIFFRADLKTIINAPFAYGLTFYGWLLSAYLFLICYSKIKLLSPKYILNLFSPAFAIAQAWGRVGCFLGGCCFGKPSEWGVRYPPGSLPYQQYGATPLIPVQIYESLFLFIVFVLLIFFVRFKQRAAWYLIMISLGRFILEFFRADDRGTFLSDIFSPSQWISAGIFIFGICWSISIKYKLYNTKSEMKADQLSSRKQNN